MSKTSSETSLTFWPGVFHDHHRLLFTSTSLQVGVVTLRILKPSLPRAPFSGRAALISVALFGILGWRIGEVTEVWSRTENLMGDSSLMESLVSGVKGSLR